ncbi:MAG: oligosaccharide flippase family protein [Clostridia bacterium]|nr:oligosaccharide flippase family protein [Clostridia bacterium]
MEKQIKFGAILAYVAIAINILSGLLYTPWMIQQIGKADYGLYTLVNSLITMFMVDFGLSAAAARYISKYVAEGNQKKANEFLGLIYKLYLIVDVIIFLVLVVIFFFIEEIYIKLTPQELTKFKTVYCIAGLFSIINFPFVTLNGVLTAYEKFVQLKLSEIIHKVIILCFTVAALLLNFGLLALVLVNAFSGIVVTAYKYIVVSTKTSIRVVFKGEKSKEYRSIFVFSFWTTVSALSQRLIFTITPTILGIMVSSEAIAVFGIVVTIEGYFYTITAAINGMFMPKISRIYAGKDTDENIMPLMKDVGRFQFALNGLIFVGFALLGKDFLGLWMGRGFEQAYSGILLVIFPSIFLNSLQIANTAMIVQNKIKQRAIIDLGTGITNVVVSFLISSKLGVLGACLSIFLAYTVRVVLYFTVHYKIMKIDIFYFIKNCYFKLGVSTAVTFALCMVINKFIFGNSWLILIAKVIICISVFVTSIWIFGLDSNERVKTLRYLKMRKGE